MKRKNLLVMGLIIIVLYAIYLYQNQLNKEGSLMEEDYVKITEFPLDKVNNIQIYRGNQKQKVLLTKQGDKWILPNKYKAQADEKKVKKFLTKIRKLEGELRADKKELLRDFGIEDSKGVHVVFLDGKKELSHIIIGKKGPKWDSSFVRKKNSNKVYYVEEELLSDLGIWSDTDNPEDKEWLKTEIVELKKEDINYVNLKLGKKSFAFRKEEIEKKKSKRQNNNSENKEYKWILESPKGLGIDIDREKVKNMVEDLCSLIIDDVIDPKKVQELKLDRPDYIFTVKTKNNKTFSLFGSFVENLKKNKGKKKEKSSEEKEYEYYVKKKNENIIYKISKYQFENIFPPVKDFINFPKPEVDTKEIQKIIIKQKNKKTITLKKFDKTKKKGTKKETIWKIISPIVAKADKWEVEDIISALKDMEVLDYTLGDKKFTDQIQFIMRKDRKITIKTLKEGEKVFLKVDDRKLIYIVKKDILDDLYPELKDLKEKSEK